MRTSMRGVCEVCEDSEVGGVCGQCMRTVWQEESCMVCEEGVRKRVVQQGVWGGCGMKRVVRCVRRVWQKEGCKVCEKSVAGMGL
jgi:hypothetical protein